MTIACIVKLWSRTYPSFVGVLELVTPSGSLDLQHLAHNATFPLIRAGVPLIVSSWPSHQGGGHGASCAL